ncbi:hypothetical protein A9Q89_12775 [Gammaproteobacteria bacterium 53_120_T64]|nr:hypothetical protein A9Q89_12775 [Gammaproteobacteria bacterium 53_120_T64]
MNDIDKTILIQPGKRSENIDATIMLQPGARPAPAPSPAVGGMAPGATALPFEEHSLAANGLNPLVSAASVILTVGHRLRSLLEHDNVQGLQRQLIDAIKAFENRAKSRQAPAEQIISARYLLCTMLDEIVLNTPWGASSPWSAHSLLSQFHNETSGGEKCFVVLQRMLEAPAQHLDVLELFYVVLSLGFEGKYKLDPRGRENIEHIRTTLYQSINNYRGEFAPDLSAHWASQALQKRSLLQYIPLWVIASCVLLLLTLTFSGFRLWLYQATEPTAQHLQSLMSETVITTPRDQP